MPPADSPPLKVVIVGAGIGGLSAAVALRRAGHDVHVFDQSAFASEVGAAINLTPNASRVLEGYGYDEGRVAGVECGGVVVYSGEGGNVVFRREMGGEREKYGAPWYLCHRVDLHDELKRLAFEPEGSGPPCKLYLMSKVVAVDALAASVTLASGEQVFGDLVVGADGIHSTMCDAIPGNASAPRTLSTSGKSAFRFVIPTSKLASDDKLRLHQPTFDAGNWPEMRIAMSPKGDRKIVMYPCRSGTLINFVCIHPDGDGEEAVVEGWTTASSVDRLCETFSDFSDVFLRLLALAPPEEISLWRLRDHLPLATWVHGRLCLLGDACHGMLPNMAQGAGQALEDGAALGVLIPSSTPRASVPSRLKLYEHVRKARAETIQRFSRKFHSLMPEAVVEFAFSHSVVAYARESLTAVFIGDEGE